MSNPIHKSHVVVAGVALACFGAGYASTNGAHSIESHRAVNQAFAAAREVDDKRQALEVSLTRAQDVAASAAPVADDAQVQNAAASLSIASSDAISVASENAVEVAAAPVKLTLTPVAKVPTLLPTTSTPVATTPTAVADDQLANVVEDEEVEKVLAGDVKDIDAARDATAKLTEVSDALDAALEEVDASTDAVEDVTAKASLVLKVNDLDAAIEEVPLSTESASEILSTVGLHVESSATLSTVRTSIEKLSSAAAEAKEIDRTDPASVIKQLTRISSATYSLDASIDAVSTSHQIWIDAENDRRDKLNDQRIEEHQDELATALADHTRQNLDFVTSRSNGWTGMPAGTSGSNGRLASSSLCAVSFAIGHSLQCDAAAALDAADQAYFSETGTHLRMTDSYRTYQSQVITKARKGHMAAPPGTSNHGWGMAVDLYPESAAWLTANGAKFGWVHPAWARPGGSLPESWHLEYVAPEVGRFVAPEAPVLLDPIKNVFETIAEDEDEDGAREPLEQD
ncbi:M15 family metallopeptidase [Demequina oxidasica]|uniref:M15 family metallopeptidase n=1 Tax=Demequina oxidasica TaxID=676199 RepID=UPI00078225F6|nr:M15 family metallopeptidase [Demequina oxidasica]